MATAARIHVVLLAGLLALPCRARGAEPSQGTYVGIGACAASNCHGSVSARTDHPHSLQNESVTWTKQDRHARATAALHEPLAFQMARRLGMVPAGADAASWLERTAHPEKCLDCHATNVPEDVRGPRFNLADGV